MFGPRIALLVLLTACGSNPTKEGRVDADDDGFASDVDCDDADPAVHPDAAERCDGVDNDCDGEVDEEAVDAATWYLDADGDGFGADSVLSCVAPEGAVERSGDCDDLRATVHPGAAESCDGTDENCDGAVDEDDAVDAPSWYADTDGDGFGDPSVALVACAAPPGHVADATDCDDAASAVNPDAIEACNLVDDDCDGSVDEDDAVDAATWYWDGYGDGFGDAALPTQTCDSPAGFTADATDCDDADAGVNPDAAERCDGVDEDCDGTADDAAVDALEWHADADGDAHGDPVVTAWACTEPAGYTATDDDCDDAAADVYPGADEWCDGVDHDCDGLSDEPSSADAVDWYADADADGYGDAAMSTVACDAPADHVADATDCDDTATAVNPGATELCDAADVDEDCDGLADDDDSSVDPGTQSTWFADADGDGHGDASTTINNCDGGVGTATTSQDCDDTDATIHPDATEVEDGVDQDCDGLVDNTGDWHEEVLTSGAYFHLDSDINEDDEFLLGYTNTSSYMRVLVGNTDLGWGSHSITSSSTYSPAVAFGPTGDYHLLYHMYTTRYVYQGHYDGASWSHTAVDTSAGYPNGWFNNAIDVAADGTVYMVYHDDSASYQYFYSGTYGAMTQYRASSASDTYSMSQAIDPVTGDVAFAFLASTWSPYWRLSDTSGTLYASGALDSGGSSSRRVGTGVTVAWGADGVLYAAWHDAVDEEIKFAAYDATSGAWTTETVSAPSGYYVNDLDLTIDSMGSAHIVYTMDHGTTRYYPIYYATNSSGSWAVESLASSADQPTYCEVQVDSNDNAHIFAILNASKELVHYYIY